MAQLVQTQDIPQTTPLLNMAEAEADMQGWRQINTVDPDKILLILRLTLPETAQREPALTAAVVAADTAAAAESVTTAVVVAVDMVETAEMAVYWTHPETGKAAAEAADMAAAAEMVPLEVAAAADTV